MKAWMSAPYSSMKSPSVNCLTALGMRSMASLILVIEVCTLMSNAALILAMPISALRSKFCKQVCTWSSGIERWSCFVGEDGTGVVAREDSAVSTAGFFVRFDLLLFVVGVFESDEDLDAFSSFTGLDVSLLGASRSPSTFFDAVVDLDVFFLPSEISEPRSTFSSSTISEDADLAEAFVVRVERVDRAAFLTAMVLFLSPSWPLADAEKCWSEMPSRRSSANARPKLKLITAQRECQYRC